LAFEWPGSHQVAVRTGMPTTYKDATYEEVLRWTDDTKIKYAPNPKGGKSQVRYEKYMKAATPAESLRLGTYAQDLFFDFEHGYIRRVGGRVRKVLLNIDDQTDSWTRLDTLLAKMHRSWKHWSHTFAIASDLGVDRRQLTADKNGGESPEVRAHRLTANEMAKMILEDCEKKKRNIDDKDVIAVLQLWGFRENENRHNVMKEGVKSVHSDTLGLVSGYDGAVIITAATTEYPAVTQVLSRRLTDHMPAEFSKQPFGFSSINVNANYAGALHRDGNNKGPSIIKAFGDFTGGRLEYWGDDDKTEGPVEPLCKPQDSVATDIRKCLLLFDGNRGHAVEDFKGERFSLVYFCSGQYKKANKKVLSELNRVGINPPSDGSMEMAQQMLGKPRGYKAMSQAGNKTKTTKPAARAWPQKPCTRSSVFLTEEYKKKAKQAMRNAGTIAEECTDTKFVSKRIAYETLADGRRRCVVYFKGISGGERVAVAGEEEAVKTGLYHFKKAPNFSLGPRLTETTRLVDVREWCSKVIKHEDPNAGKRKATKSYSATTTSEETLKKRARMRGA